VARTKFAKNWPLSQDLTQNVCTGSTLSPLDRADTINIKKFAVFAPKSADVRICTCVLPLSPHWIPLDVFYGQPLTWEVGGLSIPVRRANLPLLVGLDN